MNAQQIAERGAVYALEDAVAPMAGEAFDLLATARQGVAKLQELILDLAVHGQLLPQNPTDEPAAALLRRIHRRSSRREAVFDVSEVPTGWIRTTFQEIANDLCTGPFGSLIGKSDYIVGGAPLINPSHLIGGRIVADERVSVSPSKASALSAYALAAGDIVFARRGDVGRNAVVSDDQDGWLCGTGSFFARFDSELCRPFLHIVFDSPSMRRYLCGSAIGSTMVNLNQKVLMRAPIRLPPLAEQRRIVARVEELMGLCDQLEAHGRLQDEQHARLVATLLDALVASASPEELAENWQRVARHFDLLLDRPEAINALEQTILQLAVRGLLVPQDPADEPFKDRIDHAHATAGRASVRRTLSHEISDELGTDETHAVSTPAAWKWLQIDAFCEVQGGIQKTPLRRPVKHHFPYLRVANVQRGALNLHEIARYELTNDELERWRLHADDLLVVEGNGSEDEIGRCAIWDGSIDPCVFQNHLIRVRPHVASTVRFLAMFLNSPDGIAEMKRLAITTSGLFNLSVGKIRNIAVPLPPLAEQRRIVARVDELHGLCANLRQHLQQAQATQSNLAAALVARAVA